ncbi:TrkA C-terminal domain-containing protein [Erysipelothrix rhusiopathiae]|uniref:TrkA C-terminal domain-containing protein n=1 Tax=Erysipelothrix rhusiopathiae TaxID=1648 RepID=UPI000F42DF11|nr:TrkA C-terminal domain-containing protein [Erysipelothrix rhusiopathiae]AYV34946.1 GntR family transcriptional regulator [Erysipelothrix rhusiopathiae]MDE8082342.1 TrkA C-terminal domain-containing protein [Erysipelothrix rhusiopathiae]MDE8315025.1 TrkA C-terminal domain-containing protein [Erysipelothrix rhusiopathiae]MDE8330122.1 TrkA C-terminal domain-containing protein [Erysipelothrix rhusiopathiae]MDE8333345.1 TrkA C-terminal domain-containing protein [Erysipelothrix rhusiopathiae]
MTQKKQARYQQIALDIAARIARNDLREGERISGRSILSSEYGVSPETIRRAMSLLEEVEVVHVANNYGVIIGSKESAIAYLDSFSSVTDVTQLKHRLNALMDKRHEIDEEIRTIISQIVDLSGRFSFSDPLKRFEFTLHSGSKLIGQTIGSSAFYQTTKMTIIALNRQGTMILSPGPDAIFEENDVLVVVGHVADVVKVEMLVQG